MKKKKEFKVPSRKQSIWRILKPIFKKIVYPGNKVEYLCETPLPDKCIMVANHSAKKGPMILEIYLPTFTCKWAAHQMLGNYKSRFHYLRDIFYMQKLGWKKSKATFKAGFEAIFSKMLYKAMKMLGTYPDGRLKETIRNSMKILDDNNAIMVFPEDSNQGYKEVLTKCFPGFVMLSEQYYRKTGVDLPIYPIYFHEKSKRIIVGEPKYVQDYVKKGMNRQEIADQFCDLINNIYFQHIQK